MERDGYEVIVPSTFLVVALLLFLKEVGCEVYTLGACVCLLCCFRWSLVRGSFKFPSCSSFFPFLFLKGRERGGTRVDKSCWGRPSVCVFLVYGQVSGIVWSACFLLPCVC